MTTDQLSRRLERPRYARGKLFKRVFRGSGLIKNVNLSLLLIMWINKNYRTNRPSICGFAAIWVLRIFDIDIYKSSGKFFYLEVPEILGTVSQYLK